MQSVHTHIILLAGLLCNAFLVPASYAASEALADLKSLRAASKDGVIRFSTELVAKYGFAPSRDYSLVIFLDANQVATNPQLKMAALRKEYAVAAKAFASGPDADKIFFVDLLYEDEHSVEIFHLVQANTLPFVFRIAPETSLPKGKSKTLELARSEKLTLETSSFKYPWQAEDFVHFFGDKKNIAYAPIERPSLTKNPLFPVFVLVAAILLAFVGWKLYWTPIVQHPTIWAIGALAVFWFSVSGGMFNIIRGMPMFIYDKSGKMQLFINSRQAQLGAEGFIMGTGYLIFSGAIALLTFAVPKVRNDGLRRILAYGLAILSAYAAVQLLQTYQWKSGYQFVSYL
mmetsp:Transcript_31696/g.70465  ORF Transcript_31696/g.70465 Transcript_31696/m.70465 type:complete len:344 (+) Transcript_31696:1411-2442(+)